MKIIFLDIDGVLNSWQSVYREKQLKIKSLSTLCPICVSNLNELLLKTTDVKIVISSTWRFHFSIDELKKFFTEQDFKFTDKIIDYTPKGLSRLNEIEAWLDDNKNNESIEDWIIIDDMRVTENVKKLIQTDPRLGFDWNALFKANKLLNGEVLNVCLI